LIYPNLIPHQSQWQRLVTAFRQERLAHAYLFYGPAGSGKEGHAIETAAMVNCLQSDENGFEGACGKCPACAKARTMQHPNIQLVVPLPRRNPITKEDPPLKALKQGDLDDLTEQIAGKAQDPYFKIRLAGAQSILINSVRELRRTAYLKPGEPGWRVILIFEAEKLCYPQPAAANALLKLLEEPPDWTVFVLVTDRPHLLLDTIRSRCLGLHFPQLATEDVAAYLHTHHELGEVDAGILAQATGGNLSLARQLTEEEGTQLAAVDELIVNLLADQPTGWQKIVNDLALLRRRRSLEFAHRMQLLQLWLRDLMVLQKTGEHDRLIFKTRIADLGRTMEVWPEADWGNAAALIETVLTDLDRNINPTLVLTNMILDIRNAIGAVADMKVA
jgi:DNA polymerase-3 subunit delta'